MSKAVLFLDIDGVCNCINTKQRFGPYVGIDPLMAARLKQIVKETDCWVVLSSTWRLDEDSRDHVKKKVCRFIDVTPNLQRAGSRGFRGDEINAWLNDHPEVKHHAILDDDTDFHADQPLFKTEWATGLTGDIAEAVTKYLLKGVNDEGA